MLCFSSFKLTGSGGTKTLFLVYPTRRNHKELSLDLLHNVESVYFFYSNPVLYRVSLKYAGKLCVHFYHTKIYVGGRNLKKLSLLMYVRREKRVSGWGGRKI